MAYPPFLQVKNGYVLRIENWEWRTSTRSRSSLHLSFTIYYHVWSQRRPHHYKTLRFVYWCWISLQCTSTIGRHTRVWWAWRCGGPTDRFNCSTSVAYLGENMVSRFVCQAKYVCWASILLITNLPPAILSLRSFAVCRFIVGVRWMHRKWQVRYLFWFCWMVLQLILICIRYITHYYSCTCKASWYTRMLYCYIWPGSGTPAIRFGGCRPRSGSTPLHNWNEKFGSCTLCWLPRHWPGVNLPHGWSR